MILGTNLLDLMGDIVLDHEVITEEVKVVNLEVAEQTQNTINLFQSMMDEMYTECKDAENMDEVLAKHKKDIELIFDNKGVIFSRKISNLSKEAIIELMFNEPIKEKYEKVCKRKN